MLLKVFFIIIVWFVFFNFVFLLASFQFNFCTHAQFCFRCCRRWHKGGEEGGKVQWLWQACFLSVLAMRGIQPRVGNARKNQEQFTHFVYALLFQLLYVIVRRSWVNFIEFKKIYDIFKLLSLAVRIAIMRKLQAMQDLLTLASITYEFIFILCYKVFILCYKVKNRYGIHKNYYTLYTYPI